MKILHVITSLWTGGAEKLMVDLLPRLREQGHEVELLTFNGDMTPFRRELLGKGIKIHDFSNGASLRALYSPLNIIRLIPFLRKYDVVHTHNTAPQLFAALAGIVGRAKLVTTEHNTSNRRRGNKLMAWVDKWMYARYTHTICISEQAEKNLREHLGSTSSHISTIKNGVDTHRFECATSSDILEDVAPGTRKIVMVAGFRRQKDQATLIKALVHLPQRFHLFLIGDGECRHSLEALIAETDLDKRVHLLGERTDIPALLHAADYVAMSSHYEGLSLSSLEGMCVGKPFIASDVDGLREVVEGAGILFPHEDAQAFADMIMRLESDPNLYQDVAARCMERAKEFDISKMVQEYNSVYSQL